MGAAKMTPEQIKEQVAEIEACKADDESAHAYEDDLRAAVLRAIADGTAVDPAACAAEALKTSDITFNRWCA